MCAVTATDTRWRTTSGGSRLDTKRSSATGGVRRAVASAIFGVTRTECWSHKTINALKLLGIQQKDGDSPVKDGGTGLARKM